MSAVQKHLGMLGLRVKDRVTGFTGVIGSISFDLYGCIQATVNPGMDKEGKLGTQHWFDLNRLEVLDSTPVMKRPDFVDGPEGPQAKGLQGAAEKPPARQ